MKLIKIILILVALYAFGWAFGNAMDQHFDDKDTMLCNSALVSGNEVYLKKCQCFYNGEDIRCIYLEN